MNITILSRKDANKMIEGEYFPHKTAVISFYTPSGYRDDRDVRLDYRGQCDRIYYIPLRDLDLKCLNDFGLDYDSYFPDAYSLARFIYDALQDGLHLVCQCDYGQSRSAACGAAILEHFEKRGIDIFADYRYYPNQLVYHKVKNALDLYAKNRSQPN